MIFNKDAITKFASALNSIKTANGFVGDTIEGAKRIDDMATAVEGLSVKEAVLALTSAKVNDEDQKSILLKAGLITEEQAESFATDKNTIAKGKNLTITKMLSAGYKRLAASIGISTTVLTAFIGIAAVIAITVVAVKTFTKSLEESREELENLKTECANIASELKSVNNELDTTRKRMNELAAKGSKITFSEKEEYDNLVKANNELQRKIDLLELEEKQKNKEKNASFIENMSKDVDKKDERVLTGKLSPKGDTAETEYITETELIKRKFEELAELRIKLDNATTDYQRETFQKQIENIENYLEKKNSEFAKVANEIHYIESPQDEDDRAVNEWLDYVADFQDKMAIAMGGSNAKTNAFNRIVDNWEFDSTVQELQDLGYQGKVTADMLNNPKYNEFINKLVEIGFIDSADNLSDIALAFNKVEDAANDASDSIKDFNKLTITDTVNDINKKLKPALDSLVGTYTTLFSEEGYEWQPINIEEFASIGEQLDSLSEEFGINVPTEDYENFVTILSDSTTTADQAQQAFDDLASSMINNSNVVELTDENFDVLRNSLKNLGVVNATEVLEEMKRIKDELTLASIDLENVTYEEVKAFIDSKKASEEAKNYLEYYFLNKLASNNNPLNTLKDIEALEDECKGLRITNDLLEKTAKLKSLVYAREHYIGGSDVTSAIAKTQAEINDILNNQYQYEVDFEFNGNETGKNKDKSSSSSKDTKETFDWIETLISRIQRNITNLGKLVSATYRNWSTRNNALAQEMAEVNKEINAQMTAYNAYMEKANSIPLAEGYKALVRSGAYDISTITDEKLQEQISEYEEW